MSDTPNDRLRRQYLGLLPEAPMLDHEPAPAWTPKTPAEVLADFKTGWDKMVRDSENAPKRPPNFMAWEFMTPQQIFDDLEATDFVFVLPPWLAEKAREQWGGRLPKSVSVVKSVSSTPEFKPLPERGPMPKDVLFCIDESTTMDQTAIDRFMVSLNGKAVNVSSVTITINGAEVGTGHFDTLDRISRITKDEFSRVMEMRSLTVPFALRPEVSGDGYRKLAIKDADSDQNPHKAHLARGAQWKREKGRRR